MSIKRRNQQKLAYKREQQKANRPANRVSEAEEALQKGQLDAAVAAAALALRAANDDETSKRANAVAAEALFRQAAKTGTDARLRLLKQAVTHAPEEARLHYHLGLTEWRGGAPKEAAAATDAACKATVPAPSHPTNLAYLQQLGNLALGKPVDPQSLPKVEANTLQLLAAVKKQSKKKTLPEITAEPLLGDSELWSLLLQMYANESSAPAVTYEKARAADPVMATNPVVAYYAGVVAMRTGNREDAVAAWRTVGQQLSMPWLLENLRLFRRERATALADQGDWSAVIELYQATRVEVAGDEMDAPFDEIAGHAYFHLGFAAGQQGQWQRAYEHFRAASQLTKGRLLSQNLALTAEKVEHWDEAAESWREMVRRRPRKEDHPDYLSDYQVARIWARAAACYERLDVFDEAVTCVKNAIKYDETNIELRTHLVDLYGTEDRVEAAENELRRILEIDKDHIPSLVRLAAIYANGYGNDPKPIWQRILAIDPTHEDARMGLALYYAERAAMLRGGYGEMWSGNSRGRKRQSAEGILQEGLQEVPDQPILLIELGKVYHRQGELEKSRLHLLRATEVAPHNVMILSVALHELLHAEGADDVRKLAPKIRQIQGLRPSFWVEQGEQALGCEFGEEWARFFWDIAVDVAEPLRGEDSQAAILLTIFEDAIDEEEADLADHYARLIKERHPKSGAPEYVQALRLFEKDPTKKGPIQTQLRKAKTNAQQAKEPAIVELATTFEQELEFSGMASLFGRGNPFAELFGNLDDLDIDEEDLFDAFRRRFK